MAVPNQKGPICFGQMGYFQDTFKSRFSDVIPTNRWTQWAELQLPLWVSSEPTFNPKQLGFEMYREKH